MPFTSSLLHSTAGDIWACVDKYRRLGIKVSTVISLNYVYTEWSTVEQTNSNSSSPVQDCTEQLHSALCDRWQPLSTSGSGLSGTASLCLAFFRPPNCPQNCWYKPHPPSWYFKLFGAARHGPNPPRLATSRYRQPYTSYFVLSTPLRILIWITDIALTEWRQ